MVDASSERIDTVVDDRSQESAHRFYDSNTGEEDTWRNKTSDQFPSFPSTHVSQNNAAAQL